MGSKKDIEMATGEYFLKETQKKKLKHADKLEKQQETMQKKKEKLAKLFVAPEEPVLKRKPEGGSPKDSKVDVEALKKKVKQAKKRKMGAPEKPVVEKKETKKKKR